MQQATPMRRQNSLNQRVYQKPPHSISFIQKWSYILHKSSQLTGILSEKATGVSKQGMLSLEGVSPEQFQPCSSTALEWLQRPQRTAVQDAEIRVH